MEETRQSHNEWFSSKACWSRVHCQSCRHDSRFRAGLSRDWWIGDPNFRCPWNENPPKPIQGPGTRLAIVLRKMGFHVCDGCRSMVVRMDRNGPEWCVEHIDEILASMENGSRDPKSNPLGIPYLEWPAKRLVLFCIHAFQHHSHKTLQDHGRND